MPFDVKETNLPGVGKKYQLYFDAERSVAIVLRNDGGRELFYRDSESEDYTKILDLTDAQARTLGLFLVGAYYQPVAGHIPEETENGDHIEWYSCHSDESFAGTRLGALNLSSETGGTTLGVEHAGEVLADAPEDHVFKPGDRIIFIGDADAHDRMADLLQDLE